MSAKAVIVGGGLGGLAAAVRLAAAGCRVVLLEKNAVLGGKAGRLEKDGFTWDTGPSLLTMPQVVEDLFAAAGRDMKDYLALEPVSPVCRYFWPDGTVIDEDEEFFARADVRRFMKYAEGIHDLSGEAFLNHPPEQLHRAFKAPVLKHLRHLPKVMTLRSVDSVVAKHFKDPHLRQLFDRFATYNGSDPYRAPATFNIIPYVEWKFGAWYPRGGMRSLAEGLARLAADLGADLRTGCEVVDISRYNVKHVHGGRTHVEDADVIVANCDVTYAHNSLLRNPDARRRLERLNARELSCSGYILFLGVDRTYPALSHHNIFFSGDYRQEFEDIFRHFILPQDPTVYVSITSRRDPQMAPAGCENFFVLVNSPISNFALNRQFLQEEYPARVIRKLESMGVEDLSKHVVTKTVFTAYDFRTRDNATMGSLYGHASNTPLSALLRPPIRAPWRDNLFFVGGTTHPGGGIPLVLLSAKMACRMILEDLADD